MANTVPDGFTEALSPELFKFEKKGQRLEGILLKAQTEVINGDRVLELYFSNGRKVIRYRPGFDVKSKMNKTMIGQHLIIEYVGDDDSKGKKDNATGVFNPLKVFAVYHKPASAANEAGDPGITDDDIPF